VSFTFFSLLKCFYALYFFSARSFNPCSHDFSLWFFSRHSPCRSFDPPLGIQYLLSSKRVYGPPPSPSSRDGGITVTWLNISFPIEVLLFFLSLYQLLKSPSLRVAFPRHRKSLGAFHFFPFFFFQIRGFSSDSRLPRSFSARPLLRLVFHHDMSATLRLAHTAPRILGGRFASNQFPFTSSLFVVGSHARPQPRLPPSVHDLWHLRAGVIVHGMLLASFCFRFDPDGLRTGAS